MKIMSATKFQIAAGVLLAGLAATVIVQSRTNAALHQENRTLHEQMAQLDALRTENENLRHQPVPALAEVPQDQVHELARLRAEVARLDDQVTTAQKAQTQNAPTSSAHEVANISYNFTMPISEILEIYVQLAGKKLLIPMDIPDDGRVRIVTSSPVTKTQALHLLEDSLKEQAQIIISPSSDGTLLATSSDGQSRSSAMRTYQMGVTVNPPWIANPSGIFPSAPVLRSRAAPQVPQGTFRQ